MSRISSKPIFDKDFKCYKILLKLSSMHVSASVCTQYMVYVMRTEYCLGAIFLKP